MKILILSPSLDVKKNVSGISSVVNNIISSNVNNEFVHFELGATDGNIKENSIVKVFKLIKKLFSYREYLIAENPDIVHMNVPCDTKGLIREFAILRINKYYRKKVLVHLHGGEYLMCRPENVIVDYLFNYVLTKSDKVLVLSDLEQEYLNANYGIKSTILHNSVDMEKFRVKRTFDIKRKLNILYLGRIENNKGLLDIIEAFTMLIRNGCIFKFTICGTGFDQDSFLQKMTNILGEAIDYKGVVSGQEKLDIIKNADVFLLPSYFEGLPMSLLETMSAGVIPVVTRVGSISNVIENDINGLLVKTHDPTDIYKKLKCLIENPDKMDILSLNAQKTVEEKYSMKHYMNKLEKIYNGLTTF